MAKKKEDAEPKIAPKKAKNEAAKIEPKEIALTTELVFEPAAPFVFKTNSPAVLAEIKSILEKYKKLKITDKNFDEAMLVKRKVVSLRTMLTNREKECVKKDADPVKEKIKTTFKVLLNEVASLETILDDQFAVFDAAREAEIREVCQGYIDEFQKKYDLPEDRLSLIELKKQYFNKGQKEKDTISSIEEQFVEQKKAHDEYVGAVKIVESEIAGESRFNRDLLVEQLSYRSLTAVLSDIKSEKERFARLDAGKDVEKVTVGVPFNVGLLKGKKKETPVTAVVEIEYYPAQAEALKAAFDTIGVSYKFLEKKK